MAIAPGNIIEAKDVRDRITSILDSINTKISLIENATFFNVKLSDKIVSIVSHPEQTSAFIDNFNNLSNSFRSLSNVFNVEPGKIIYLKGFYEYTISCFAAASDIRWSLYTLIKDNQLQVSDGVVSYLNDSPESIPFENTPLLSSSITPQEKYQQLEDGRFESTDFRFNHASNDQTILSSVEKYSSYNFNQIGEFDPVLSDIVDYGNLNNDEKWMYIGQTIFASHANGMFNVLEMLNIAIGKVLSCEYWWIDGLDYPSVKPKSYIVNYFDRQDIDSSTTPVCTDTAYKFIKYKIKTWTEATKTSGSVSEWVNVDSPSRLYKPNSTIDVPGNNFNVNRVLNLKPQISKYNFLLQAWNMDDQNFTAREVKVSGIYTRYFQFNNKSRKKDGNKDIVLNDGTHYVNFCKLIDRGGLTVSFEGGDNTYCKISGFPTGFNWMKFDAVKLWINEIYHTHPWRVYVVDCNRSNLKRLIIDYNAPTWQTEVYSDIDKIEDSKYINGGISDGIFYKVVFSSFTIDGNNTVNYNSNTYSNHKIGLRILTENNTRYVKFRILSEFGPGLTGIGDKVGSRELFFYPVSLNKTGKSYGEGFKNITLFN